VVTKRHLDPGAMATPGAPLLTIVSTSGYHLDATVPENHIAKLHLGDDVLVNLGGLDTMGSIGQIVPAADVQSRTMIVKVALPRLPGMAPGRFGRARFKIGGTRVMAVPQSALWQRESLSGVLVVENGVAHRRLVTVGRVAGGTAEILSGVQIGEEIVARDANTLSDGSAVRVVQRLAQREVSR
jgi:RND family efflux transporter MFP subunit